MSPIILWSIIIASMLIVASASIMLDLRATDQLNNQLILTNIKEGGFVCIY